MAEVVFINCFQVPAGREQVFLELWHQIDDHMRAQPGYRWVRLHRSLDSTARFRYVNVAGWDSAEQHGAGHDEKFHRLLAQEAWQEFPSLPALYTVEVADHT